MNHRVILTPLKETGSDHLQRVRAMWEFAHAEVLTMSVEEHDAVLAATSHLPHAIAYSLVDTLANDSENENIFRYAAGGFRDFTRIASSDPLMWHDIMQANRKEVLHAIDLFQHNLDQLRHAIEMGNSDYLLDTFTRAKKARDHFTSLLIDKKETSSESCTRVYVAHFFIINAKILSCLSHTLLHHHSHHYVMLFSQEVLFLVVAECPVTSLCLTVLLCWAQWLKG